jgi:cellulose synthase/poly-beta-1,6-N-acetylglucosamine synthase-like glycosyltransferase
MTTLTSVVVPAYHEGPEIAMRLLELNQYLEGPSEVLLIVDSEDDPTLEHVRHLETSGTISVLVNSFGRGPANAIRFGIENSNGSVIVVFMSDGCDDALQVSHLVRLVRRGVAIAAASRYANGGQQVGGPRFKRFLSKLAGISFRMLTGVGTWDATNSFKAYDREFLRSVQIESRNGFEIGIELVSKAHRLGLHVAELPTIWIDRDRGVSKFRLFRWIPHYLRWYLFGIGIGKLQKSKRMEA